MTERIKLMIDYNAYPLWDNEGCDFDPKDLPISDELVKDLQDWVELYNQGKDPYDLAFSAPPLPEEQEAFEEEGIRLWQRLQKELGEDYEVIYHSQKYGQLRHPDED